MTREDFTRWREDPVTRAVIAAHRKTAEDNKAAWMAASWENGHSNPATLQELRVRADAYLAIAEMNYEGVMETLGLEPTEG
jgi:hypothetical protein